MTTVAFAGIGAIGLPMALRLADRYPLVVSRHRGGPAEAAVVATGAHLADSPRQAAKGADVLISMVRDQAQTDAVVDGPDGAFAGLAPGAVLVVMSTLSPDYCAHLAARCRGIGVHFLDAPVSGGVPGAERGELTIMVGGPSRAVELVRPILDVLGQPVVHLGDVGAGQVAKIVNNAIKIAILAVTTEQLDVAVHAGLDLTAMLRVLRVSTSNSHVVEHWDHYYAYKETHRPGGPLDILHKDLSLALALAARYRVDVPVATALNGADVGRVIGATVGSTKETA
jgi:3-hydroxyisobutyrate dehydrogenase-like beta-hydroxyacid dehydrogenase